MTLSAKMLIRNSVGVLVGVIVGVLVAVGSGVLLGGGVPVEVWVKLATTGVALGEMVIESFTSRFPLKLHPLIKTIRVNPRDIPAITLIEFLLLPIILLILNNISCGC